MLHGKVDIEHVNELRMRQDGLRDTLSSKRLLPESLLDLVENFGVSWVGLIEYTFERLVRWTETVTEVLCKDPSGIYKKGMRRECVYGRELLTCIGGFLDGVRVGSASLLSSEEGIVWETVEQRSLLGDLVDRVLDRWSIRAGKWVQIESYK
jgi:hypothetical protein